MNKYPKPDEIPSAERQRIYYEQAVREIETLRAERAAANTVATQYRHDRDEVRQELGKTKRTVVTLTKKQKAADESKKAAAWSGGAAISVTILYQLWHTIGFPFAKGGNDKEWQVFWEHEAVYGAMVWLVTVFLAAMYRATKE